MNEMRHGADIEDLLSQMAWVRRLARGLVHDASSADDLTQDALVLSLSNRDSAPRSEGPLRAWLATLVRRLAIDRGRSTHSRELREAHHVRAEAVESPLGIVERSERQQQLVRAVHALSEPYRSCVLYRYLDELPTAEIARRTGVDDAVVRKRLSRGLAQLRTDLERGDARDLRAWLVALIGAPAQEGSAAASATAGSTSAGMLGGLAVLSKWVVVASIAVALACSLWVWQQRDPGGAPTISRSGVETAALEPAPTLLAPPVEADEPAQARGLATTHEAASVAPQPPGTLRVRVQRADGSACDRGRISMRWMDAAQPRLSGSSTHEVHGAATDVPTPANANQVWVAACAPELNAAAPVRVPLVGAEPRPREVVLTVGTPFPEPRYEGRVLVDGSARVPAGFWIEVHDKTPARVDLFTATYVLGPLAPGSSTLWITSDETAPRQIELETPPASRRFDLELTTGPSLDLTILAMPGNRPAAGRAFPVVFSVCVERSLSRNMFRDLTRRVTTGSDGHLRMTGLPTDGRVSVLHDAPPVTGEAAPTEPLWSLRLSPETPERITATVRLAESAAELHVRGTLPPDAGPAVKVMVESVDERGQPSHRRRAVPSTDGRFDFAAQPGTTWRVWLAENDVRVSAFETVRVEDVEPEPLHLALRPMRAVELRLVNAPAGVPVRVRTLGEEPVRSTPVTIRGGEGNHVLRMGEPAWIEVDCGSGALEGEASLSLSIYVDPSAEDRREIDLGGDRSVPLELAITGVPAADPGVVVLRRLGSDRERATVWIEKGRSSKPARLAPGRWFWFHRGPFAGFACGVVDVVEHVSPIHLECALETHARAGLGDSIELLEVDGVEHPALVGDKPWRFPWSSFEELRDASELWLPADLKYRTFTGNSR